MQVRATNTTAAFTGVWAGLLALLLGPRVDAGGPIWLFLTTAAFAGPAYFFVFGLGREDMIGLWVFRPDLIKRVGMCFAGAICVATIAQLYLFVLNGGAS